MANSLSHLSDTLLSIYGHTSQWIKAALATERESETGLPPNVKMTDPDTTCDNSGSRRVCKGV